MKQLIVEVEYKRTVGMLIEIPDEHQAKSEGFGGLRIREQPGNEMGGTWITPAMAINSGLAKVIHFL